MDSKTYWSQREAEQLKKNTRDELEYNRKIKETYDYMLDNIQKEINGFYSKYVSKEGITLSEAKKRVSRLEIEAYERKAKRYVKDKTFTAEANEEMRLYNAMMKINRLEMLKANIGLELVDGFDELQKYFDTTLTDRTLAEFKRQAGILGKSILNNEKAAHSIVNASYQNAKFSDRIWMYQDMLKNELAKQLKVGLIQGKNPRELARHISKVFGVSRSNAERLMQTELARVQTDAQKQSYERNGYDQYVFIAEATACPICRALDDKTFKVVKMMPGTNAAPMHPNCKCSTAGYMDREEFDKWLDEIEGQDRKAGEVRKQAEQMEPDITKTLKEIEKVTGSKLQGLEHRLKSKDRILEKIAKEPGKKVRDALRYTYEIEFEEYVEKYQEIVELLKEKGYTLSEVKNYWTNRKRPYNGLNTNVFTDGKYEFEIQYHTEKSLRIKEEMHKLYEKQRLIDDEYSEEYIELTDRMFELSNSMKIPEGIEKVK